MVVTIFIGYSTATHASILKTKSVFQTSFFEEKIPNGSIYVGRQKYQSQNVAFIEYLERLTAQLKAENLDVTDNFETARYIAVFDFASGREHPEDTYAKHLFFLRIFDKKQFETTAKTTLYKGLVLAGTNSRTSPKIPEALVVALFQNFMKPETFNRNRRFIKKFAETKHSIPNWHIIYKNISPTNKLSYINFD